MLNLNRKFARPAIAALILASMGLLGSRLAHADEARAKDTFKKMSDYIAAQKRISFNLDSSLEIVTTKQQKIALASTGTVVLSRPDKIRVTRTGGFSSTELLYDGKTITLVSKDAKQYAQVAESGKIDDLVDVIRQKYGKPIPAADLLGSDAYGRLMSDVLEVQDFGSGVIRGTECDHFGFRLAEADVQVWIAQGARPYPCRYVITSTKIEGSPQYTVDVSHWRTGNAAAGSFGFKVPRGFEKVAPGQVRDGDELPDRFTPGK